MFTHFPIKFPICFELYLYRVKLEIGKQISAEHGARTLYLAELLNLIKHTNVHRRINMSVYVLTIKRSVNLKSSTRN